MPQTGILKYKTRDGEWRWKFGIEEIKAKHCMPVIEYYDHKGNVHPETIVGIDGHTPNKDEEVDVVCGFDEYHIMPSYARVKAPSNSPDDSDKMHISGVADSSFRLNGTAEKHKPANRFSVIPDCTLISLAFEGHSRNDGWYQLLLNTPAFLLNKDGITVDVIRQH